MRGRFLLEHPPVKNLQPFLEGLNCLWSKLAREKQLTNNYADHSFHEPSPPDPSYPVCFAVFTMLLTLLDTPGPRKYSDMFSEHPTGCRSQKLTSTRECATAEHRWIPQSKESLPTPWQLLPTISSRVCSWATNVYNQTCPCSAM